MSIDVAVIPCAGAGTRMRPATRSVPKPLLPVIDRPVIQYVVQEAVDAGVTEVVLVVDDRPGDPVMSHFTDGDPIPGLEDVVFTRTIQPDPHGLGHAVLCAADAVGDRPFMCLLSDRFPRPGKSFATRLAAAFDGRPAVAVFPIEGEQLGTHGVVAIEGEPDGDLARVVGAVEKPGADRAPSNLGLIGRYIFTPDLFEVLASQGEGFGGEIQLTDAIDAMARATSATGLIVDEDLLDIGVPSGMLEATAVVGLSHPELAGKFKETLEHLLD